MKSYIAKAQEVEKKWYVVDAVGGLKEVPYREVLAKKPEAAFEEAVKRMLPSGVLGRKQLKNLKVYRGSEHNHDAQKPEVLELKY